MLKTKVKVPIAGNAPISKIRTKNMDVTGIGFFSENI